MPDGREVELKLELPAEFADALLAHPSIERFREGEPRTKRLRSVYFDTSEHALVAQGISLRIRSIGSRRVQTVKRSERAAGGLFERREHEVDVASAEPNLDVIDDVVLRDRVASTLAGEPPIAIFETDMERVHVDQRDGDDRWELALDRGHVIAGTATLEISELELELIEGAPPRLFDAALALIDDFPLVPGGLSKAGRGYALTRGESPKLAIETELADLVRQLERASLRPDLGAQLAALAQEAGESEAAAQRVRSSRETARAMLEAGRILAVR